MRIDGQNLNYYFNKSVEGEEDIQKKDIYDIDLNIEEQLTHQSSVEDNSWGTACPTYGYETCWSCNETHCGCPK